MITIKGLRKDFGPRTVLDNIHLELPSGRATGIVGPNGSGKTTTIKALLGLVKPTEGAIYIDGESVQGQWQYRQNIGYMPQTARYPENMSVNELFEFISEVRGNPTDNKAKLIEYFDLEPELDKRMRTLSGGTRQKVGAVLAMMFDPRILIFDEPTAGLDPRASVQFKKLVHREKEAGKTILLTSHIMSEIEELADYLIFIVEGRIRYHGPMKELIEKQKEQRLEEAVAKMMEEVTA
ncbi:ABC transporter ATP-binding protein [Fodinibius sediminis]|uniref:Cu-processing system ATP-binding protein n=1 Tax=Fodinibius sediminis TaxID=1214077 RepID=A0A521BN83_9BACT|nr:ABC transporter ATP-binding protein [Fodinibius sediminis]SMO48070.1 Cu-processing system ATP-binding protein [Fodinibius sediminis]